MSYMFYNRRYDRKIRHDQNTQVHTQKHKRTHKTTTKTQHTKYMKWFKLKKESNISKDEEKLDKKEKEIILTEVMLNMKRLHAAC